MSSARAREIGEQPEGFTAGIRMAIARMSELTACPHVALRVAL